ncbi:MAG: hypothetical protein B7Y83_16880 [Flavobacteriales bacterium 32-34-25]|nr:MAG: hypothetical protein B7Y83_16880 [Flavobacteriales bacterium 32-34-25]
METDFNNIFIFETNIKTEKDKQTISEVLNANNQIERWNIDLEDIDSVEQIIKIITVQDFKCAELSE